MAKSGEIGRIGQRRYGGTIYEEFLHELQGKRGIEVYREMSENDDVVGTMYPPPNSFFSYLWLEFS